MSLKVKIVILAVVILFLVIIINMIRKRKLELKYALSWLAALITILVIVLTPNLLGRITHFFGIKLPTNMIFFFGFIFMFIIMFVLTVALSRMSRRVRRLAQIIALEQTKTISADKNCK